MGYVVRGNVEGLDGILRTLEGLKDSARRRITRRMVTAGGRVILKRAKALAPKETGLLRKSLGQKVKVYQSTGVAVAVIGPRLGHKKQVTRKRGKWFPVSMMANPVPYAHLVELGTKGHGKHPGAKAQPFLTPAARGQGMQVRDAMAKAAQEGLAKEVARLAKDKGK